MRLLVVAAVTTVFASPSWAQDEPKPAVFLRAEQCLTDNVAAAVRSSSGAADAAEFLLTYLCAEQVERAGMYERNLVALAGMKAMVSGMTEMATAAGADADQNPDVDLGVDVELIEPEDSVDYISEWTKGINSASVDQDTGELRYQEGANGVVANLVRSQAGAMGGLLADPRPVFLRVLAGQLVVEHRR